MTPGWDPGQYERFKSERRQPFDDLLGLVRPHNNARVIDLGCGTGELTAELHSRLHASETLGADSSKEMLERALNLAHGGLHFANVDIGEIAAMWSGDRDMEPSVGGRYDLVFSNAALQWVPDHRSLVPALLQGVMPGGQIALQVPANFDDPSHLTADEVAREEPFRSALADVDSLARVDWVLRPEEYARILDKNGAADQHVRLQVYGHHLRSSTDLVEWMKGTLLTPYRSALDADTYAAFLDRYRERLIEMVGDRSPYFFAFKRILLWARL